jgi:tetratricopeptide (TPR) repeat protein
MTLATCLEDQGELAKAEEICRAVDERYQASELFSFVARTGHGDLEAAWKLKQAMLRESTAATAASRKRSEANYKLYSGKLAEASRLYEELVEEFPNSHSCLQLAALADELGQPEARDEWWRRALETKEGVESNDWYASQMAAALLTNPADFTPVIAGIGKHGGDPYFSCYLNLHYYAGRNCECHDRKEEAVKHYTEAARTGFRDEAVEIDAWRRLRKLGGDPSKLQPYWSGLRKYR